MFGRHHFRSHFVLHLGSFPQRPKSSYKKLFNTERRNVLLLSLHNILFLNQLKAPAPQTSSSVKPQCTAFPSFGFVMRTPTVQMGQMRPTVVSCVPLLPGEKKQHLHESDLIVVNLTLESILV